MYSSAVVVYILNFLQISYVTNVAGQFSILMPQNPIIGLLGKEIILPCRLTTSNVAKDTDIRVHWILTKLSENIDVKSYHGRNKAETQDDRYQGRTEFSQARFSGGDMSLTLKNLQLSDEGKYTCMIFIGTWYDEVMVELVLAGKGTEPAISLVGYKGHGIDLTCSSQGWYPEPQVFWLDREGKHQNETSNTQTQMVDGIFSVFTSIIIEPEVSSETTCKITNDLLQSKSESRILISDAFYPTTSPWLAPFIILLLMVISLGPCVGYKLKENNRNVFQHEMKKNEAKVAHSLLQQSIESEKKTREGAGLSDLRMRLVVQMKELDVRRAQSHAVAVTLDSDYKHKFIDIGKDEKSTKLKDPQTGEATSAPEMLTAMGKEGYAGGKQYWEVRVGDIEGWQVGALTESARAKARQEKFAGPLREGFWALRNNKGDLYSEPGENKIERKGGDYSMIGLFLDQEEGQLSFYTCGRSTFLITSVSVQAGPAME